MSLWQRAEETLKAIQNDLAQDPPNWESAARSTENLKLLVPDFPKFKGLEAGEAPPRADWRIVELRTDLDHLRFGLTKQDKGNALGSVLSALGNVRALRQERSLTAREN